MKLSFETVTPDEPGPTTRPPMQLHMTWIDGTDDETDLTFDVSCGAGLGSSLLQIKVKLPDGTTVYDYGDIRPLIEEWVDRIREREGVSPQE